jgi:hypothetical protein
MTDLPLYRFHATILAPLTPLNTASWTRGGQKARRKQKQEWHFLVRSAVNFQGKPPRPLALVRLSLTRLSRASREPDYDNEGQGGKWLLDGLVLAGVLQDDRRDNFEGRRPEYLWRRVTTKAEQGYRIELEEVRT